MGVYEGDHFSGDFATNLLGFICMWCFSIKFIFYQHDKNSRMKTKPKV